MTQVVIDDVIPRTQAISSAGQTVFNTNWTADATTDINVYARASGVEPNDITQLVSPSLYNVTFVGGSAAVRVTFLSGRVLNDVITIVRNTPAERTNLYINTNFVPSMLNQDFGILTLVDQQAQMYDTVVNPGYNVSATIDQVDKILPILGAQQVWRKNEDNTAFEAYTIDGTPAPSSSPYVTYTEDDTLENPQNLGLLASGILKQTVAAGVATLAIAIPGVDYLSPAMPLGTMAYQDSDDVNITGGVGNFTAGQVATSPVNALDLVNKAYADSISAGFIFKASCYSTTTTNLTTTYNNGASGVGATLTATGNGVLSMDGVSPPAAQRVCVRNQSTTYQNGIYVVTQTGSVSLPFILTRATDFDSPSEILPGSITFIQEGTLYGDTSFVETEIVVAVGTSPILFSQFSQTYPLSMGNGGTGASLSPVTNGIVYSTASNLAILATLASGVLVTSAGGVPSIATTLPAGLTIPGYATSGANANITSMTGLTGQLRAPTSIGDSLGNNVLGFAYNVTPVNYFLMGNSATGQPLGIQAVGTDPNIQFNVQSKGTAPVIIIGGTTTNPLSIYNGTAYQHGTNLLFANTSALRNVTFQDADGTLAYLTDRGFVLLGTAAASSSAAITFTGVTGYKNYMLVFNSILAGTNGATILMDFSINNGSSWLSSVPSYYQQSMFVTTATVAAASDISTLVHAVLSGANSNLGSNNASGFVVLENLGFTNGTRAGYTGKTVYINTTPTIGAMDYWGQTPFGPVNALRLLMSAGVIVSGTVQLYGMI